MLSGTWDKPLFKEKRCDQPLFFKKALIYNLIDFSNILSVYQQKHSKLLQHK